MPKRIVITGIGAITPLGTTAESIRTAIIADSPAFTWSTEMPDIAVSPVQNFDLRTFTGRWKHRKYLSRGAQFAVAAALQAVANAGFALPPNVPAHLASSHASSHASSVPPISLPHDTALFVGTGPNLDISADFPDIHNGALDSTALSALWLLKYLPNTAASSIAQLLNIHGENSTVGTACSASLQAIGEAYRRIKSGYADIALAGGGDSRLSKGALLGYQKAGALWNAGENTPREGKKENTSFLRASRPFDGDRSGFVAAEGGAMFVLESYEHAIQRGATILGEVHGYGITMDGHAMTAPHPEGTVAEQAVINCLQEAGVSKESLGFISAHGTSTPLNDTMESLMLERVCNAAPVPPIVMALKSWLGHGAATCGAMELAVCLATLPYGIIPPIRNLQSPCSHQLHFAGAQTEKTTHVTSLKNIGTDANTTDGTSDFFVGNTPAMKNAPQNATVLPSQTAPILLENFGFGGQNAALLVTLSQS